MSLKTKVALIVTAVFVLYALAEYAIQHFIIYPEFVALEHDEGKKNMDRVLRAIKNEMHHLDKLCHDWAAWDDTNAFVNSPTDEYIETNLPLSTFVDSNIHFICFLDANGKRVWSEAHNLETGALIHLPYFEKKHCQSSKSLISFQTKRQPLVNVKVTGVFRTAKGLMLVASRPVLTSNNEGPIRGAVILGRFLNDKIVKNLTEQTLMQFRLFPLFDEPKQQHLQAISKRITDKNPYFIDDKSDSSHLYIYSLFKDIKGNNAFLVRVEIDRRITVRGLKTMYQALLSKAIAGLAMLIIILSLLQYSTLQPLDKLKTIILNIGQTGELAMPLSNFHRDEIGTLATEFDKMLRQLKLARKKIAEQSHRFGMAEMASEILHNIRNTLTPLTGQIELLNDRMRKVMAREIYNVITELEEDSISEQRRSELVRFSILANKDLINVIKRATLKLDNINNITQKIEKMLDDYQFLAYSERILESIRIKNLISDSLQQLHKDLLKTIVVNIDLKDAKCESLYTDRIALLKVFIIILTNAAESAQRRGLGRGEVQITIEAQTPEEPGKMTSIQICDNGEGIKSVPLEQIFQRNFTTKAKSSSVFGLHWCANTITALGGQIFATNREADQGACIQILLPRNSP
ncbi:CHASE4 domain-containing protein [Desulfococcaceae bacterium HSG9]|nr:CHASE4 domain-containing protein [Desulfococcaceae bacterium HSG9]